jgi:hypothetical protein
VSQHGFSHRVLAVVGTRPEVNKLAPVIAAHALFAELRADATAQAVRIWSLVDRAAFHREIAAGLRFLASLATDGRGIRYSPDKADINVWATIFAVQAYEWAEQGRDSPCIV